MAQSPTISIPKKTTQEVDWTGPIRSIIATSYGESPDSYSAECATLQRFRQDAVRGAGSDFTARDLLYKYFGQLELLELRFSEIKVSFPWADAFTTKVTTQTSLAFEKASIIFQIAATHSAIASTQTRSDPEGLKRSFHYFRTAAGMLTYINDNFLHAPSVDLSREVVKYLVGIMLAQATEVFLEKIIEEKKSGPALMAKVASQASFLYLGLNEEVKEFFGKGIFDRNWVTLIQIKSKYFTSMMHYYRFLADEAASKHGDALSRITLAESLAKEAYKLAASWGPYFIPTSSTTLPADAGSAIVDLTKAFSIVTSEKKSQAQRDNDLIYNAIPTPEATLPAIDKLSVAAPIPIHEVYGSPDVQKVIGPDLFIKLIPLSVHTSASVYSEEKAKLARGEVDRSDIADADLAATLDSLELPAGLKKWKDLVSAGERGDGEVGAVPSEVEGWADELERDGGLKTIEGLFAQVGTAKANVGGQLEMLGRKLEDESRECETMRVKYEHLWTQEPSASFSRPLRQDLKSHNDSFRAASSSDDQVVSLWESVRPDVSLLLSGSSALERFFTEHEQGNGSAGPSLLDLGNDEKDGLNKADEIASKVAEIDATLGRLNKIKRERGEVLKDLKQKIQTDDVSHLLLLNHRSSNAEPALFAAELEKFRPYQARVTAAIQQQEATLEELVHSWKALKSGQGREWVRKAEGKEKKRGDLVARLYTARDGWLQVKEALGKGLEFYRDLGELVKILQKNIDDFVRSRTMERESLASQIEVKRRLTGASSSTNEKPPLPPPPTTSSSSSYDLSSRFGSLNVSSPPPQTWHSPPPPPLPQSSYSSLPPPPAPPRQPSYSTQSPTTYSSPNAGYGLPPPPLPPPSQHPQQSAPAADPYSNLFNTPGLPSAFSLGGAPSAPPAPPSSSSYAPYGQQQQQPQRQGSLPPPPPPPSAPQTYGGFQSPPPTTYQPQPQYSHYSTPPPQQQQQHTYYQQQQPQQHQQAYQQYPPQQPQYGQQPQYPQYGQYGQSQQPPPPPPPPSSSQGPSYYGQQQGYGG